jgi:hypothetical protein
MACERKNTKEWKNLRSKPVYVIRTYDLQQDTFGVELNGHLDQIHQLQWDKDERYVFLRLLLSFASVKLPMFLNLIHFESFMQYRNIRFKRSISVRVGLNGRHTLSGYFHAS